MNKKSLLFNLLVGGMLAAGVAQGQTQLPPPSSNNGKIRSQADAVLEKIANDPSYITVYADDVGGSSYKLPISVGEYFQFKQMSHENANDSDYVNWVTYNNATIKKHAEYMTKGAKTLEEKANILLDFVHTRLYEKDPDPKKNYVKYPIETMVEGSGDCEDVAILGAALMKAIGIDVALIVYDKKDGIDGHVALGINGNFQGTRFEINGKDYFYVEATGTDWLTKKATWKIGDMPKEYQGQSAFVYPIK